MKGAEATELFVLLHSNKFDAVRIQKDMKARIAEMQDNVVPVVSHEGLSGNFLGGLVMVRDTPHRLHAVFPDACILIGVREQGSLIRSLYGQYVMGGGVYGIDEFLGPDDHRPGFRPPCDLERFEFDLTVATYQKLFGRERVLVLPQELLRSDPDRYMEMLMNFSGAHSLTPDARPGPKQNVGIGAWAYGARRRLNRVLDRPPTAKGDRAQLSRSYKVADAVLRALDRIMPPAVRGRGDAHLRDRVARRVKGRYVESNRRLAAMTGLPLAELGYQF